MKGGVRKYLFELYEEQYFGKALQKFNQEYGYEDLLLITKKGDIVYTVNKGPDLGQNLITGELKDTGLAKAFNQGLTQINIQDFTPYPPVNNQNMIFIAAPVFKYKKIQGVVVLRLGDKIINSIVHQRKGMGKSGETYLIGRTEGKQAYRSERIIKQGKVGDHRTGKEIDKAFNGESGTIITIGSTGAIEIVRYDPLDIPGLNWVMNSTISIEEVIAPVLKGQEADFFSKFISHYGYEDIFIIHPNGDIFYSAAHKADYGTNLLQGQFKDSGLAALLQDVIKTKNLDFQI